MTQNLFAGTWRLVSAEYRTPDGQVTLPYGRNPVGYIMYDEDGYMSVAIMHSDRPKFATEDRFRGTTDEKAAASDTYLSYCGRYETEKDKIIHHVEASLFPNWVGTDQERFFRFDKDRLSLTTPPFLLDGIHRIGHLIWKRV